MIGLIRGMKAHMSTEESQKRPNFLVILTDDQGPWAMPGLMPELQMPALEELMTRSTVLENFYCASPVCSPARASLMTGRMPSAHGIHDWLVGERHPDAHEDVFLGGLVNLPEVLNRAGYSCAMSGKWHIGTSRRPEPGFDYWYAHRIGGGPYYNAPIWSAAGEKVEEPEYFTYAVANHACDFITKMAAEDAPFYCQVNFTAPHDPWIDNHPDDLYHLYDDTDFPSVPREEPHPWVKPREKDFDKAFANPKPYLQGYAGSLTGVDRTLKQMMDTLEEQGVLDNTVIIYMADNGFSCGHHGVWGKGNGTYPMNFWENSVRVPFVIHMPGQTERRDVTTHISGTSYLETICDLAGVKCPDDPLRAGRSVAGLLRDASAGAGVVTESEAPLAEVADDSIMIFDEYGGGRMIRRGDWKFVDRFDGPRELYNLANDPEERENLADTKTGVHEGQSTASIQDELRSRLHEWFAAHETIAESAYHRDVRGRGQIHPPRKGYDDERTYARGPEPFEDKY